MTRVASTQTAKRPTKAMRTAKAKRPTEPPPKKYRLRGVSFVRVDDDRIDEAGNLVAKINRESPNTKAAKETVIDSSRPKGHVFHKHITQDVKAAALKCNMQEASELLHAFVPVVDAEPGKPRVEEMEVNVLRYVDDGDITVTVKNDEGEYVNCLISEVAPNSRQMDYLKQAILGEIAGLRKRLDLVERFKGLAEAIDVEVAKIKA